MSEESNTECEDIRPLLGEDEDQGVAAFNQRSKRISFPADSILNAIIQDGDVIDLLFILRNNGHEIDINQTTHSGLTALHHAVLTNNMDMAKLLLNHGADVHTQDIHGLSPLHTAAAMGLLQMTSFLIMFGADVFCHTKQAELPIDLAKDMSVIRLLNHEMYFKTHEELKMKSKYKIMLSQFLKIVCEILLSIFRLFLIILTSVYHMCLTIYSYCQTKNNTNTARKCDTSTPGNLAGSPEVKSTHWKLSDKPQDLSAKKQA